MKSYPMAADGLKLMFYGEIISLIGIFLSLVSVVGVILCIVGPVLTAYGLFKAAGDDEGYRTAFYLTIAEVVVNLISAFFKSGGIVKSLLSIVVGLAIVYYVCTTTANLLHAVGQEQQSAKGRTVWLIYLICALVSVVVQILAIVPILNILAAAIGIIMLIVQLVGYILYLVFLYKSGKALELKHKKTRPRSSRGHAF